MADIKTCTTDLEFITPVGGGGIDVTNITETITKQTEIIEMLVEERLRVEQECADTTTSITNINNIVDIMDTRMWDALALILECNDEEVVVDPDPVDPVASWTTVNDGIEESDAVTIGDALMSNAAMMEIDATSDVTDVYLSEDFAVAGDIIVEIATLQEVVNNAYQVALLAAVADAVFAAVGGAFKVTVTLNNSSIEDEIRE